MIQPKIFGKFILLERVSIGGMAEVFRAKLLNNPDFERFFAIKRILPHLAKDNEFVQMFKDEAKVAVDLEHPNVCQIYELGRLGELHYIAMEYIAGRDVEAIQAYYRKQKKIMSVSQACFIIAQGAQGLDYAHKLLLSLNFVHRDVSPQNLLVTYDGVVKLIDFGVAKASSSRKSAKSDSGVVKGKFSYMSPEQAMGLDIDRRSDIFALGVVFWELLTGRRLFAAENEFAIMDMITECKIEKPSRYNRMIPEKVERICMKALEKDVNKRYQWASEMVDDLFEFINECKMPFTQWHLQNWMCTAFKEAFDGEWAKIPIFNSLNTEEDVEKYNAEHAKELGLDVGEAKTEDVSALSEEDLAKLENKNSDQKLPPVPGRGALPPGEKSVPNVKSISLDDSKAGEKSGKLSISSASDDEIDDDIELEPEGVAPTVSDPALIKFKRDARRAKARKGLIAFIIAISVCFIVSPVLLLANIVELPKPEVNLPTNASIGLEIVPESDSTKVDIYQSPKVESSTPFATQTGSHVKFDKLDAGVYIFHVEIKGYAPEEYSVEIANGTSETRLELTRQIPQNITYKIQVTPEDANVYLNDTKLTKTAEGYSISGIEGEKYHLEVRRSGFEPVVKSGSYDDEEPDSMSIKLDKTVDVSFNISSEPSKATVYFITDDKAVKQGSTPFTFEKLDNSKPLTIEVRKSGYQNWTRTIDFNENDQNIIRLFADMQAQ